jgi:acylphosphatase
MWPRSCSSSSGSTVVARSSEQRLIRRRAVAYGYVQGVFFRDTTRRRAEREGVAGWVRNCPDGSLEALFEGELEPVERLVRFVREGPRGARVERVDVFDEEPEGLNGFEVR